MNESAQELKKSFDLLRHYHFPMQHVKISVYDHLQDFYKGYMQDVATVDFFTQQDKESIQNTCNQISKSINLYNQNDIIGSYSVFFELLDSIQTNLYRSHLGETYKYSKHAYYRVQKVRAKHENLQFELLHCSFQARQWVSPSRFSLSGIPSTYMSTTPELAWYESRMPSEYYIARYAVSLEDYNKYSLLYLASDFRNMASQMAEESDEDAIKRVKHLFNTIPLIAACSYATSTEECNFREEYIVPQMLMSWVQKKNDMIGILYSSSSPYDRARKYSAYNIAIPTREIDSDGYCKFLKRIFVSDHSPQIIRKSVANDSESLDNCLDDIRQFIDDLRNLSKTSEWLKFGEVYQFMIDLCKIVILGIEGYQQCKDGMIDKEQRFVDLIRDIIADMFSIYQKIFDKEAVFSVWMENNMNITHASAQEFMATVKKLLSKLQKVQQAINETERELSETQFDNEKEELTSLPAPVSRADSSPLAR